MKKFILEAALYKSSGLDALESECLKLASEQNKLLIISVGYSSCHWCHVMEEETFSDEKLQKL